METHLILHCSPTLAGIKTANLFSHAFTSAAMLMDSLSAVNKTLNPKGIHAEALRIREGKALILVYRSSRLQDDLNQKGAGEFLTGYGYRDSSIDGRIARLKERCMSHSGFPHEIGLFLGYPLCDVIGFIENKGKNSRHTGCWKVYQNEHESVRLFNQFQKCKNIYTRLFLQGRPIERLIVAA